ncbi:MAG: damage-control phosphatase ARMT1 family protein [Armatimonadota bacterium]
MKTSIECLPCLTRQIVWSAREFIEDPAGQEAMAKSLLNTLIEHDMTQSPPILVAHVQRALREYLGDDDPYREIKYNSNSLALEWYDELRTMISESDDPFQTAVRISIAGNIIDYGLKGSVEADQIRCCIDEALSADIDQQAIEELRAKSESAQTIMYLADNSGELVFDRLLIEQLSPEKVVLGVKGYPTLNDVTIRDAEQVGLADEVRVVSNGTDIPGTVIEECTDEFRGLVESADLVIAKGQANYETLCDISRDVTFLFMPKCPLVAKQINCKQDSFVVMNYHPDGNS